MPTAEITTTPFAESSRTFSEHEQTHGLKKKIPGDGPYLLMMMDPTLTTALARTIRGITTRPVSQRQHPESYRREVRNLSYRRMDMHIRLSAVGKLAQVPRSKSCPCPVLSCPILSYPLLPYPLLPYSVLSYNSLCFPWCPTNKQNSNSTSSPHNPSTPSGPSTKLVNERSTSLVKKSSLRNTT